MDHLNSVSIKNKLKYLISMSILLMLLIAGGVLMINTVLSNKKILEHELNALAEVISLSITPAIIFDNSTDAQQTLATLKAHNNVIYAAVTIAGEQQPFAVFLRDKEWQIPKEIISSCEKTPFNLKFMHVCKSLVFDQVNHGHITLVISLENIYHRLLKEMGIALLGLALAALLIFWFLEKIAKKLSDPILELVAISEDVKHSGDYQLRANITSTDEIGQLATAFNDMLEQIDNRNQALEQQKDTLEDQVQKRTLDLQQKTNEAYQLANKAEAASKAKSEFLTTMSHEIRTPMNGVLGMTELLQNTSLNNRQKRLANTAYRSAESLLGIINNILDFSKIESGKFQLIIDEFNLHNLLEDTIESIASQAHSKGLELVLDLPLDFDGAVRGDAERLRQVLINLLGNAIKFTQHGEIQLKVRFLDGHSPSDTHLHLLFEVRDTGSGIALEQQDLIFESFTQADGSITRRYGGTGLGLTISRQLLEMMDGQLKLNSSLGQGSCFSFSLCLERSNQILLQKTDISSLQGINILIVDDNATNREILSSQLSHWGISYYCVANGAQAIDHLLDTKRAYHVALLDWHMPEMDGITLAKILYNDSKIPPLPIVMLSSDTVTFNQDKSENYGIDYFLTKPVIQQKLLNCLLHLMGATHSQTDHKPVVEAVQVSGHILLAEDNLVNQEVGMAILRSIGCQAEVVNNGLEAVKASASKRYDVILMDCHMPVMDGIEATKKIREHEKNLDKNTYTPIIALTADVQKGIIEQCKEAGMDEYISKPFSQKQLQDILTKFLPQSGQELERKSENQLAINQKPEIYILDPAALNNLRPHTTVNGGSLLNKTITLFLDSAFKEVGDLQHAFDKQDNIALARTAHSFKSACANLGIQTLADYSASIEAKSNQESTQGVEALLKKITLELPDVITALNKELNTSDFETSELSTEIQTQTVSSQNKRILLVDDDISFRLITNSVLTAASFLVDEASTGNQALEKIKHHKPDLILLDAIMDQMDGFETCQLIRKISDMADVPIIMSTGLGDIDSINRAFESGATDFIEKPINYSILTHRLSFMLRAGKNASELRNSKLQLTAAQRIARLGYWVWNVNQNQFQISEQLADLCSIDLQTFDATLEGFIALIQPEEQNVVKEMILEAPYGKTVQHIEYRLKINPSELIFVHQEMVKVIENGHPVITGTVQDISQRKETERKIHNLAYFDHLTGLASRTYYQEHIQTIIKTATHRKEKFAFLFLDLDGFKDINDSMGHNLGDQLLKIIAQRLQGVIRDADFAARLGGDEFCILLNDVSNDEFVTEVAQRCLLKINEPLFLNQQQIKPRVSIGIAIFPRDGKNEVDLMKAADTAMYAAKRAGKQRYTFYSQDMASEAITRLEKEQMLREAFEKDQFILHFQPQISMQTGHMVGMEALVRWQHPEKGMLPPADFIPDIERLGLVVDLGNWVLKAACEQLIKWYKSGMPFIQVGVNISAVHFQDSGLLNTVQNILSKTSVPAKYLELEVTESAMQAKECLSTIQQLRQLGIKVAIDDFGTGFSCLASLKQLPLDCLKIDKVFVDDILTNSNTSLLLGTIIGLGNALNYTLVAEGVENREQALIMHGLGCQIIQGYFFSRPVPSDEIPALVNTDFSLQIKVNDTDQAPGSI